jgi:hypothetical protein
MPIENAPNEPPDTTDLSRYRLDQSFTETAGVKKPLTTVPVRKPNPQDFTRVHPSKDYRDAFAIIELKDDRESYLVLPKVAQAIPGEFFMANIHTAINRQGTVFLWPIRMPGPDGKMLEWHRSAAEAASLATRQWVRVKSNQGLSAYDIFSAEGVIADPAWPEVSFEQLLRIGFKDRMVDTLDHAVLNACAAPDMLDRFQHIVAVDFEFNFGGHNSVEAAARSGERPQPVCMVARDLRSGQTWRLRRGELGLVPGIRVE